MRSTMEAFQAGQEGIYGSVPYYVGMTALSCRESGSTARIPWCMVVAYTVRDWGAKSNSQLQIRGFDLIKRALR